MKSLEQHLSEKLIINKKYDNGLTKVPDRKTLDDIIFSRQVGKLNNRLDLSDLDVSEIDNFDMLFASYAVGIIDLSGWITTQVTNMNQMFYNCTQLTDIIGIEDFDLSSVENMQYMFAMCSKLKITEKLKNWKIDPRKTQTTGLFYKTPGTSFKFTQLD